jgi:tetratricopeptide (TPR) repeat protein
MSKGTLTDAKGRFSVTVGTRQATRSSFLSEPIDIDGCLVQVRMAGFEEVVVTLKKPQRVSDLNIGDLTLKAAGAQGSTGFSETGRSAPGKARSNYVRAIDLANTGKFPDALASLDKAIGAYPKYASALQLKGVVLERTGQRDQAREAYQQAATADPAYAMPLVQLAELAAEDQNPKDAVRWAAAANQLAPGAYPNLYLIEGSAQFDLRQYDDAEKAIRAGIAADPKNVYPALRKLMGELLYRKRSYAAALESFEWYLQKAPQAADVVEVQAKVQTCKRLVLASGK